MQSYMKPIVKKWQQKGAVLALSALLLPMIVVGTGFAVDLGNIYVQYSRLQNAADAAALAGAHEYADKKDTLVSHGHADKMAKKALKSHRSLKLDPMNPYERKVIHATLQSNPKVTTRSEGQDPYRRVVIEPKR